MVTGPKETLYLAEWKTCQILQYNDTNYSEIIVKIIREKENMTKFKNVLQL